MKQHDQQVSATARETAPLAEPDTGTDGSVWEPPPGPSSVPWADVYADEQPRQRVCAGGAVGQVG